MAMTFACVLRSGGDYTPQHVRILRGQVEHHTTVDHRFVCLSDVEIAGVDTIPLQYDFPGWWACVELWSIQGPTVVVGLDTIIVGSLDKYFNYAAAMDDRTFLLPTAPYKRLRGVADQYINGVQIWNGDWSWLVDSFDCEIDTRRFRGDENYLIYQLFENKANILSIQKEIGGVYSYALEYQGKDDASIVYFHGKKRPWTEKKLWAGLVKRYGR